MNSRALRRLASDHAALHAQLPPNYLFPSDSAGDALTELDILLTGPTHTPFAAGVWKLHLNIPPTYPQQPPTANFRTPIFHPNVDPQTGGVCVETLKRDWDASYTLSHVLQTISCLLIQPNPDSALNAEAGALIQEGYDVFARRAELMTSISAAVPASLRAAVLEAQTRGGGQEAATEDIPVRRRRPIAQARARAAARSPPPADPQRRGGPAITTPATIPSQAFVLQAAGQQSDVFGRRTPPPPPQQQSDDTMTDADQENEQHLAGKNATPVLSATPRRPHGTPVPLGEMIIDDVSENDDVSEDMEPEYPPSPRKSSSPAKSPAKRRAAPHNQLLAAAAESSRVAAGGRNNPPNRNITPLNHIDKPLAADSPFAATFSVSPRKVAAPSRLFAPPPEPAAGDSSFLFPSSSPAYQVSRSLFGKVTSNMDEDGDVSLFGTTTATTAAASFLPRGDDEEQEWRKRSAQNAQLWELCGRDVKRWNQGDFGGQILRTKAPRW